MKPINLLLGIILVVIPLSACAHAPAIQNETLDNTPTDTLTPVVTVTPPATSSPTEATSTPATTLGACRLDPVTQPAWPTETLQPNELDPEINLHMTGKPQRIDLARYRLKVTGLVDHPLSLTYDDLRCMRQVTDSPELVCPQVFTDEATWTGVPIKDVLELAVVQTTAKSLTLVSADGYEVHIPLETAMAEKNFLAYEVNGRSLPVQHGFPLRAVFPEMWGSYWLKWLVEIRIS